MFAQLPRHVGDDLWSMPCYRSLIPTAQILTFSFLFLLEKMVTHAGKTPLLLLFRLCKAEWQSDVVTDHYLLQYEAEHRVASERWRTQARNGAFIRSCWSLKLARSLTDQFDTCDCTELAAKGIVPVCSPLSYIPLLSLSSVELTALSVCAYSLKQL